MGRVRSSQVANTLPPPPRLLGWHGRGHILCSAFVNHWAHCVANHTWHFFLVLSVSNKKPILTFETKMWISVFRDKKENSFLSVSYFETRTRICSLNLGLWDKNEKFCHSIWGIQMRTRIYSFHLSCISFVDLFQSVFFEKRTCNWRGGRYNVWQRPNALLQGL